MEHSQQRTSLRKRSALANLLSLLGVILLLSCTSTVRTVHDNTILPTPLAIHMNPAVQVAGVETRVTCQLPTDLGESEGTYHFAVVPLFSDQGPIDRLQISRLMIMPCEPIRIVCGYTLHGQQEKFIVQDSQPANEDCK